MLTVGLRPFRYLGPGPLIAQIEYASDNGQSFGSMRQRKLVALRVHRRSYELNAMITDSKSPRASENAVGLL